MRFYVDFCIVPCYIFYLFLSFLCVALGGNQGRNRCGRESGALHFFKEYFELQGKLARDRGKFYVLFYDVLFCMRSGFFTAAFSSFLVVLCCGACTSYYGTFH